MTDKQLIASFALIAINAVTLLYVGHLRQRHAQLKSALRRVRTERDIAQAQIFETATGKRR